MILRGRDLSEFELRVAGYQFPELEHDDWDSNWLIVEIRSAPADQRPWKSVDPSLLTWEVERLSNWLEALASGEAVEDGEYFVEPTCASRLYKERHHYHPGLLRAGVSAALVLRPRRGDGRSVDRSLRGQRRSTYCCRRSAPRPDKIPTAQCRSLYCSRASLSWRQRCSRSLISASAPLSFGP